MSEFAAALENYLPEPQKEIRKPYITLVKTPKQYDSVIKTIPDDCSIYCRTLDGSPCDSSKCIAFCWSKLHRGYITKNLMLQHQCLEKNCIHFQKLHTASYWIQKESQAQARKTGKQLKKQIALEEAEFLRQMRDLTIHDFNFYPVAAELKNNTYEVRFISFESVDYSHYLALFNAAADGRSIHFTKIKTDKERKQQIIEKHNIVKIPEPAKPFALIIYTFIKDKFTDIIKATESIWSKLWKKTTKKD